MLIVQWAKFRKKNDYIHRACWLTLCYLFIYQIDPASGNKCMCVYSVTIFPLDSNLVQVKLPRESDFSVGVLYQLHLVIVYIVAKYTILILQLSRCQLVLWPNIEIHGCCIWNTKESNRKVQSLLLGQVTARLVFHLKLYPIWLNWGKKTPDLI